MSNALSLSGLEENKRSRVILNDIYSMKVQVVYQDSYGQSARTEASLISHYSPRNRHIKVFSSTQNAKVTDLYLKSLPKHEMM